MREPEYLSWPLDKFLKEAAKVSAVKVHVEPDEPALYQYMANEMAAELRANNKAGKPTKWIIPVGPVSQYPYLAKIINDEKLDCSKLLTFQMDEYLDWTGRQISHDNPLSFFGTLQHDFFGNIDKALRPDPKQHHAPNPRDLDEESEAIKAAGGIDTCWGGIGIHGHVAFNEPPEPYFGPITDEELKHCPTRIVHLNPDTMVVNSISAAGGNFEALPPFAVSIGMGDILASKRIRLCVHRRYWSRAIWRRAVMEKPSALYPVTFLQEHPDACILVDEATAEPAYVH